MLFSSCMGSFAAAARGVCTTRPPSALAADPSPSQIKVAKDIIAKDGFGSLYKGLNAGLLRQATYTTARLGIFQIISEKVGRGAHPAHGDMGEACYRCTSFGHLPQSVEQCMRACC